MFKQIQTAQRSFQTFKCSPSLHELCSCAQSWSGAAAQALGHQLLRSRQHSQCLLGPLSITAMANLVMTFLKQNLNRDQRN